MTESTQLSPVDVSISPVEKFREFLATKQMRWTRERETVVNEIFTHHEHFDAEQLNDRLNRRRDGNRASRSTVYRTLELLEEAGIIRVVARAEGREVFEHDYGYPNHDHLICEKCGDLIEFRNDSISDFLEQVAAENGFRKSGHRLEVYGVCATCNRPPQRRHRKLDML